MCVHASCSRLGLTSLAYLWHRNQRELLKEMIDCKLKAIVIKVAALGAPLYSTWWPRENVADFYVTE